MTDLLYWLFYLGVLALVVGGLAYLYIHRDHSRDSDPKPARLSRETAKQAAALGGSYRLSELESILERLAVLEAWGMVLELRLTTVQEILQMIVDRNEVELCAPSLEPSDTELFRRAAREAGLEARSGYTEGQVCVDVKGTWPQIASTVRSIIRSIHGVGDGEEAQVHIFN